MSYIEDEGDYAGDYDYTPEMYEDDLAQHELNLVNEDLRMEREVELTKEIVEEIIAEEAAERDARLANPFWQPEIVTEDGEYDHHLDTTALNDEEHPDGWGMGLKD